MKSHVLIAFFFLPLLSAKDELLKAANSTETTITEKEDLLVRNATKPAADALLRSPVAYNQGSLIPSFPAVSKIRGKAKKPDSRAEIEEDVRQLVNSLNHKKSGGGAFSPKRGSTGSNRAQFLVEIDTGSYTGDPYASGYRGLPESQVAPSNSYLGAITKSGRNGANRNTFGSYGSVDSAKGQSSLTRAGIGSSTSSDPYKSGYTAKQSVLGYGGYGQGYGSNLNENQASYVPQSQDYGTQPSEQASVYPVYGGTNQQPETYGTQDETAGDYSGYSAAGSQPDYSGYGNQSPESESYGSQPEYNQYGAQQQGGQNYNGYGATPVYKVPEPAGQQTEDYYPQTQQTGADGYQAGGDNTQPDAYSGYGNTAQTSQGAIEPSGYGSSGYASSYGASENTQQPASGYESSPYGNYAPSESSQQPSAGYGSSVYNNYGTQDNTQQSGGYGTMTQGASEYTPVQESTDYSNGYSGADYSNYGQSSGTNNQQTGTYGTGYRASGTDYQPSSAYSQGGYTGTTDYQTQQPTGYGSNYQTNYQNGASQTADYSAANYGSTYNTQQQPQEYATTGYGTQPSSGYSTSSYQPSSQSYTYSAPAPASSGQYSSLGTYGSSSNYGTGYQAPAAYQQGTAASYQTSDYASAPVSYGSSSSPYAETSVYLPDTSRYQGQIDMSMGYGSQKSHNPLLKAKLTNIKAANLDGYKKTA